MSKQDMSKKVLTELEWEYVANEAIFFQLEDKINELDPESSPEEIAAHKVTVQEEAFAIAYERLKSMGQRHKEAFAIAKRVSQRYGIAVTHHDQNL